MLLAWVRIAESLGDRRDHPRAADLLDREKLRTPDIIQQAHAELVNDRFDFRCDRCRNVNLRLEIQKQRDQEQRRRPQVAVLLSAAAAPELMAVRIAALLMPPRTDMNTSLRTEACISRRTSWKKDIGGPAARLRFQGADGPARKARRARQDERR